jgi:hypothetical protein
MLMGVEWTGLVVDRRAGVSERRSIETERQRVKGKRHETEGREGRRRTCCMMRCRSKCAGLCPRISARAPAIASERAGGGFDLLDLDTWTRRQIGMRAFICMATRAIDDAPHPHRPRRLRPPRLDRSDLARKRAINLFDATGFIPSARGGNLPALQPLTLVSYPPAARAPIQKRIEAPAGRRKGLLARS